MAKKSFKDNPALQFISSMGGERDVQGVQDAQYTHNTHDTDYTHDTHSVPSASAASGVPERKTKRLNLLIRPALLADVAKIAHMRRSSVNDLINTALAEYRTAHASELAEYDRVFGG